MENIYQLLSQQNFTFINQKIDDYKCIICQRILINAHQAYCGCNYCEKCVDEQVRSGLAFCPGDTEECKTATLSSVAINHRMNRQIAQLVVKCPEEMCCYESQLRNMGDHLRLCGKRNVECPFTDFGCGQGKLKRDELNEHLQQASYRHSEILIDVIRNLRNEFAELKRDREKCDVAIDKLVKSDREKAVIIDSMKEEIESMKVNFDLAVDCHCQLEKAVMEQRVDNLGNTLDGKVDKIVAEIEAKLVEMRREWRGAMEQQQLALANVDEINEVKYQTEIAERIDSLEKCLARIIDVDFVMTIDNIAGKIQRGENIFSEYFNECTWSYKMRLRCYINGIVRLHTSTGLHRPRKSRGAPRYPTRGFIDENPFWDAVGVNRLHIHLVIDAAGVGGVSLRWPFERNVTITIINQNATKTITKRCSIGKPLNDSSEMSSPFLFDMNELTNEGVLQSDRLTVRCVVHAV